MIEVTMLLDIDNVKDGLGTVFSMLEESGTQAVEVRVQKVLP